MAKVFKNKIMYVVIENYEDYTNISFVEDEAEALAEAEELGTSPLGVTVIKLNGKLSGTNIYIGYDTDVSSGDNEIIYKMYEGEIIE